MHSLAIIKRLLWATVVPDFNLPVRRAGNGWNDDKMIFIMGAGGKRGEEKGKNEGWEREKEDSGQTDRQ